VVWQRGVVVGFGRDVGGGGGGGDQDSSWTR